MRMAYPSLTQAITPYQTITVPQTSGLASVFIIQAITPFLIIRSQTTRMVFISRVPAIIFWQTTVAPQTGMAFHSGILAVAYCLITIAHRTVITEFTSMNPVTIMSFLTIFALTMEMVSRSLIQKRTFYPTTIAP